MDTNALFKIGYGLYVLTASENDKDNGCIINTVMQITSEPCMIAIAVNKKNYINEMIQRTKKFNISTLTEETDFDLFKHFGFQSGKNTDKFLKFNNIKRANNGVLYITQTTNSYFSAYVKQEIDLGSHTLFLAQLVDAQILSEIPTVTYDYYQKNIKQITKNNNIKGWRCKICGYVYDGNELPADFICPWCKHGAIDFERIQ